jgi:hypothetical protein
LPPQDNPACLAALLAWLGLAPKPTPEAEEEEPAFPYHRRDDFLSPAELSFFHVLRDIVSDKAIVCPKVSLGDLFYAATGDYGRNRSWMNRIDRKHVDFLICYPGTIRPRLGVELDDASREKTERQERDWFVDRAFAAAGLPLARIEPQRQYKTDEVLVQLRQAMAHAADEPAPAAEAGPQDQDEDAPPPCPRCGAPMALRQVKREGPRQGEQFWGCPNFPMCRGTRDLEEAGSSGPP